MSSNVYLSYIPEVIRTKTIDIYNDAVKKLAVKKVKEEDLLKDFTNWPRGSDSYTDCINCLVNVGLPTPKNSIQALCSLIPSTTTTANNSGNLYTKLVTDFEVDSDNIHNKELFDFLIHFIFADSVAQLVTYVNPKERRDLDIHGVGIQLLEKDFERKKTLDSKFLKVFENLLLSLLRQCSILIFKDAQSEGYDQAKSAFAVALTEKNISPFKKTCVIVLYRFLPHPPEKALDFVKEYLLPLLSEKKLNDKCLQDTLKWAILQIPTTAGDKLAPVLKSIDKYFGKKGFEYQSILMARTEETTIKSIAKFLSEIPKGSDNESILNGFLYILRGSIFYPNNEFWEYGEKNGEFKLSLEKKQIFQLPESKDAPKADPKKKGNANDEPTEIGDEVTFCGLFLKYIADKLNKSETSTKIIFNLLSRNLVGSASTLITVIGYVKNFKLVSDALFLPLLNALTFVFDQSSGFVDGKTVTIDTINTLKGAIKTMINQKYHNVTIPPRSKRPLACRTVSVQSCPNSLSPNDDTIPESFSNTFRQRIEEAKKAVSDAVLVSGSHSEQEIGIKVLVKHSGHSTPPESSVPIYLISLLYQTVNKFDSSKEFFIPLVELANCEVGRLAFFALYSLQVFYITKEFTVQPILSAINQVVQTTIGQPEAFTLLNLLYQLLSLPRMNIDEESRKWFDEWTTELQAILLAQLLSPYSVVRDMALLVMQRLDTICQDYGEETTITSLMNAYRAQMSHRVANRIMQSDNEIKSFDKIYFDIAARSSNLFVYSLFLSEYAQVLLRPEMEEVIKRFWNLKVWEKINFPQNPKNYQVESTDELVWKNLPIISFTQKLIAFTSETAKKITEYYHFLPNNHFLEVYEIYRHPLIGGHEVEELISNRKQFWDTAIPALCQIMTNDTSISWPYEILASLANSSSIELMASFIAKFVPVLVKTSVDSKTTNFINIINFSRIMRCVALSPDFVLVASTQLDNVRVIFSDFFKWYHNIFKTIGIKCEMSNLQIDKSGCGKISQIGDLFIASYCSCIQSFARSLSYNNNIGVIGAVRGLSPAKWIASKKNISIWPIEDRRNALEFLLCLSRTKFNENVKALSALLALLDSVDVFDNDKYQVTREMYDYFLELETKEKSVRIFHPIVAHHKFLLPVFLTKSIKLTINKGFYFYRAYCDYFVKNEGGINVTELSEEDIKANNFVVRNAGEILLSALMFIGSSHEDCRKKAFQLLKRAIPIFCAYVDKSNIEPASVLNTYLEEHRGELCVYSFAPTENQCFELASKISENIPFVVPKVFNALLGFFLEFDSVHFSHIDSLHVALLLNIVSPFARHITFRKDQSAYPNDFLSETAVKGFDVVSRLLAVFPCLLKTDHINYSRIFGEMCSLPINQANVQPLANLLVMNAAFDLATIPAATTVLLFLVQRQPAVILQLLTQRLSFGYWFTRTFGATVLAGRKFDVPDWIDLSIGVLREVALANFSLLFPYVHYVVHFCLVFYNRDLRVRSLFQSLIQNFDPPLNFPPDLSISFTSKTPSDSMAVRDLVYIVGEQLQRFFPSSIEAWKLEALRWATSCGDLTIAHDSGQIYSYILADFQPQDTSIIVASLNEVLTEYSLNPSLIAIPTRANELFEFLHSGLRMLASNAKAACKAEAIQVMQPIFRVASHFFDIVTFPHFEMTPNLESESSIKNKSSTVTATMTTAIVALQIIHIFVDSNSAILNVNEEQIMPRLHGVARMVPTTFNETNIAKFLTALIANMPAASSRSLKTAALGLLLPIYYAASCAYHSIEPFSTFVKDELVIGLFECATKLGQAEFAGDSQYSEIFIKYFDIDLEEEGIYLDKHRPIDLIDELTTEYWASDPEEVKNLGPLFHTMCSVEDLRSGNNAAEVRSATFAVVKSFVDTCPESKREILRCFDPVLSIAIAENGPIARNLISKVFAVSTEGKNEANFETIPAKEKPSQEQLIAELTKNIQQEALHIPLIKEETINFQDNECKMLMLCVGCEKHDEKQINALSGVKYQPYLNQINFWSEMQNDIKEKKEKTKASAETAQTSNTLPEAFDFFAHAKAMAPSAREASSQYARKPIFDPQCFILRDEEFDSFEKRLDLV